jgi:Outer membrane protein beta-barrel domain
MRIISFSINHFLYYFLVKLSILGIIKDHKKPSYMKTVLLALSLLLSYSGQAQSTFGFKGGLNICKFTGPGVIEGASTLTAVNFGLFDRFSIARTTSLQVELSVSGDGESFNNSINNVTSSGSFHFTYLDLPLLIHQKIVRGLFVETGPQVGLLLGANLTTNGITSDYTSQVTSLDFCWDFGIGYKFSKLLALNMRYNAGISNLASPTTYQRPYRDGVFSLNILLSPFKRNRT